jgi:hypothetical protein
MPADDSAPRCDFDDPAIRAKYLPGGKYGRIFWPDMPRDSAS